MIQDSPQRYTEDDLLQENKILKQKIQELETQIQQQKQENQLRENNLQYQINKLQDENNNLTQRLIKMGQDNDKLLKQIESQKLPNFDSKKNEIKFIWNISKKIYKEELKPLKEFQDRFEIGDTISAGSYSKVYKLQNLDQENEQYRNQELVVKVVEENAQQQQLIQQQINQLPQNLRNYILTSYETYSNNSDNILYMIQQKAKHSLFDEIKIRRKLNNFFNSQELQYSLGCSLLGLVSLDSLGLAHRNIKPDNLLVMNDNSIKISGLSIAEKYLKQYSIIQGTPQYWAPENFQSFEQLQDNNYNNLDLDLTQSDLYAIGQSFLEATLLVQCVKACQLNNLQKKTLDKYVQDRQQQHEDIITVLRNDPEKQDKVKSALERLELEEQKNLIPQLNSSFIDLLEKMVEKDPENRITLQDSLEELLNIQDW